jgi:septal ring factor EnvC (AmiA/AmiB activator)
MEAKDNGKGRCPVCGKYASKAMTKKYNQLVQENETLNSKLTVKDGRIGALEKECKEAKAEVTLWKNTATEQKKKVDNLEYENRELKFKLEQLRNRGLFARLFNLQD